MKAAPNLHRIGGALFGPSWQTPMAAALGVNIRTMQRLASGGRPVSAGMWADISGIAQNRHAEIAAVVGELTSLSFNMKPDRGHVKPAL